MANHKWANLLTEEALSEQIELAKKEGRRANQEEARSIAAIYSPEDNLITIQLKNGAAFSFPPQLVEGLKSATTEELQDFWMPSSGDSIHWDHLEVSLGIPELLMGIFGPKQWMAELGRSGGKVSSSEKRRSSAENDKKGRRPQKVEQIN